VAGLAAAFFLRRSSGRGKREILTTDEHGETRIGDKDFDANSHEGMKKKFATEAQRAQRDSEGQFIGNIQQPTFNA